MNDEHKIIQQVYAAKEDMEAADRLIGAYMPFIKAETAKFLKRPPMEGHDDELSIAMIAFHEAIRGYSRSRGAFLKYAAMLIKSRLIDYHRRSRSTAMSFLWTLPQAKKTRRLEIQSQTRPITMKISSSGKPPERKSRNLPDRCRSSASA